MKTNYFNNLMIDTLPAKILQDINPIIRSDGHPFDATRSTLLILDMQRYFLDPDSHAYVPSAPTILANLVQLRDIFLRYGYHIILTRHLNTPQNAGMMSRRWNDLILEDDPMSEIAAELVHPDIPIVPKHQYDAFFKTGLHRMLQDREIDQVVITGVMTHLCVETTARSAFMKGYTVWLPVDGTATYNEDFHRASLMNLGHGFANIVLMKDLLVLLGGDSDG